MSAYATCVREAERAHGFGQNCGYASSSERWLRARIANSPLTPSARVYPRPSVRVSLGSGAGAVAASTFASCPRLVAPRPNHLGARSSEQLTAYCRAVCITDFQPTADPLLQYAKIAPRLLLGMQSDASSRQVWVITTLFVAAAFAVVR